MVNYVCRTCLYVCDNELSFRRLEKVRPVLELFVPEIKTFVGKYSLICEQCYYFLKNVEKFKLKCLETQKRLYSVNFETIKDTHDAILQSVAKDIPLRENQIGAYPNFNPESTYQATCKRSDSGNRPEKPSKQLKTGANIPVAPSILTEKEITLTSILNSSVKPIKTPDKQVANNNYETAFLNSSAADDILELFNCRDDLKGFREFAVKGIKSNNELKKTSASNISKENSDELIINYDDDEYMTRKDLVSAGILSDDSNKSDVQPGAEAESDDDIEMVEITIDDDSRSSTENAGRVEIRISDSFKDRKTKELTTTNTVKEFNSISVNEIVSIPMIATVKQEMDDENPGFFNKQFSDGFYKCRLCNKKYKTSKGLYQHTKKIHGDELKFHHCDYCSFFTLWKSSLTNHCNNFHAVLSKKNKPILKCYHCSFKARSKDKLSRHILDKHEYHMEKECSDKGENSDSCTFLSKEEYFKHIMSDEYRTPTAESQGDSVIKSVCSSCSKVFNSQDEYKKHQYTAHSSSFTIFNNEV